MKKYLLQALILATIATTFVGCTNPSSSDSSSDSSSTDTAQSYTPVITTQPAQEKQVATNQAIILTISVEQPSKGTLSYQWFTNSYNSSTDGLGIDGATGSTLYLPLVNVSGTLYFYCAVTNTYTLNGETKTEKVVSSVAKVIFVDCVTITGTDINKYITKTKQFQEGCIYSITLPSTINKWNGTNGVSDLITVLNNNTANFTVYLDFSQTSIPTSTWPNWCSGAKHVVKLILPPTLTELSAGCVWTWNDLQDVVVSSGTTTLNEHAFAWLDRLLKVTLPDSITTIKEGAFDFDFGLRSTEKPFILPKNLTSLGQDALRYTSYTDISLNNNSNFSKANGMLYDSTKTTAVRCFNASLFGSNLNNLPSTVTTIGAGCFRSKDGMFSGVISIPTSVTIIGDYAFELDKLSGLDIPTSVTSIGAGLRADTITLESGNTSYKKENHLLTTKDGTTVIAADRSETAYTIPDTVTTIGKGAFVSANMTTITIPASVTTICNYAFANSKLTTVTVPETVTNLGTDIFAVCNSLENASILANCDTLQSGTFYLCINMKYVILSSSITLLDDSFSECTSLKEVFYLGTDISALSATPYNNQGYDNAEKYVYGTASDQWQYVNGVPTVNK